MFGTPGVRQQRRFLEEINNAEKIQRKLTDCVKTAKFKDQSPGEVKKFIHIIVVGGGPTAVGYGAKLHNCLVKNLSR
ncbi:hypothetical protein PSTG_18959 [Puccinia striiformis f. sp. tritici PST-78]|uniref:NADH:ubiquinone reductase (non-electrogenic) n=1 Tax=Puccinia striiformis f. sp. tritici PST-78 TaxID=1165861 RepID=A0A0L0UL25_9BASI|nr:hypothetical protein PSTG_18959 [Puccinia striiformis f. sp. tritici PST-78]